jgi:hypothetical protein
MNFGDQGFAGESIISEEIHQNGPCQERDGYQQQAREPFKTSRDKSSPPKAAKTKQEEEETQETDDENEEFYEGGFGHPRILYGDFIAIRSFKSTELSEAKGQSSPPPVFFS